LIDSNSSDKSSQDTQVADLPPEIPGYELISKIGSGGMATVYLAVQQSFGRKVALKVMAPSLAADAQFGGRFIREANIVSQLSHPNIVTVYDVGVSNHYHYISMDYLPGKDLKDLIAEGLPIDYCLRIIRQVALALAHAHGKGYIHRDVKPDNVLFREDGDAVLSDFGIALDTKGSMKMTKTGKVIGTPVYMSPEQARGEIIDSRADLYALGVLFYEMLMGEAPFNAADPIAVGIKHIKEPIPELPASLSILQPFIERLLAKLPQDRYQHAREFIDDLDALDEWEHSVLSSYSAAKVDDEELAELDIEGDLDFEDIYLPPAQSNPFSQKNYFGWILSIFIILAAVAALLVFYPQYFPESESLHKLRAAIVDLFSS
jgi:serine/threonine protein kinase